MIKIPTVEYEVRFCPGTPDCESGRPLFGVSVFLPLVEYRYRVAGEYYSRLHKELALLPYYVYMSVLLRRPWRKHIDRKEHHTTIHLEPEDALTLAIRLPHLTFTEFKNPDDLFLEAITLRYYKKSHTLKVDKRAHPHRAVPENQYFAD